MSRNHPSTLRYTYLLAGLLTCLAALAAATAAVADAQPPDAMAAASLAFNKAYDAAMQPDLDSFCPGTAMRLAAYLAVLDEAKARDVLERCYDRVMLPEDQGGMHDITDRRVGECFSVLGDTRLREASACLRLAEIAVRFDSSLARRYLEIGVEAPQADSPAGAFLVGLCHAALDILDGQPNAARDKALDLCRTHGVLTNEKEKVVTQERALAMFVAFDQRLALEFASRFDVDLYGKAVADVAAHLMPAKPDLAKHYYKLALDIRWRVTDRSLHRRMLNEAGIGFGLDGPEALVAAFRKAGKPREDLTAVFKHPDLYQTEFARRLTREQPVFEDAYDLGEDWSDICLAEVRRHPNRAERVARLPDAPHLSWLLKEAAKAHANRGEFDAALEICEELAGPGERSFIQAHVARQLYATDPAAAMALFETTFQSYRDGRLGAGTAGCVARYLAEVDREAGTIHLREVLGGTLDKLATRNHEEDWRAFRSLVWQLALLDHAVFAQLLAERPEVRQVLHANAERLEAHDLIERLAHAVPDILYEILKEHAGGTPSLRGVHRTCIRELAHVDPEKAARFLEFEWDPARKEQQLQRIAIGRLARALLDGEKTVAELLETYPPDPVPSDMKSTHPLVQTFEAMAENDFERAVQVIATIPDTDVRDIALWWIHWDSDALETLVPLITSNSFRVAAWRYAARDHLRELPEWRAFVRLNR